MFYRKILRSALAFIAMLFLSTMAHAGLFRSYVSSTGSDVNPCSLSAPCRLLTAALAAVNVGGEIWMLDSVNYNTATVTIGKSVTILAVPGVVGSVLAIGGNAIDITTAGVKVALRNLVIVPFSGGGGVHGIEMTNGATLKVENCLIANLPGKCILINAPVVASVSDTIVRDNSAGIELDNGASATITRAHVVGNLNVGIWAVPSVASTVTAYVNDTVVNNNGYGIVASGATGRLAKVYVTRTVASGNLYYGFYTYSANAVGDSYMELSGSVASRNSSGIYNFGSTFESAGDNRASGNTFADVYGTVTITPSR